MQHGQVFFREYNKLIVLRSCLLYIPYNGTSNHNHNQKDLNNVLNQNINVKKRARFATFAISIANNFCLLQQQK